MELKQQQYARADVDTANVGAANVGAANVGTANVGTANLETAEVACKAGNAQVLITEELVLKVLVLRHVRVNEPCRSSMALMLNFRTAAPFSTQSPCVIKCNICSIMSLEQALQKTTMPATFNIPSCRYMIMFDLTQGQFSNL